MTLDLAIGINQKYKEQKEIKTDKLDFSTFKNFNSSKCTIKKVKQQPR